MMTIDYYRVLDLPRHATPEAIHTAYRALALEYHPDRNTGPAAGELSSHMVLVNEAYACLRNASSRQTYDRKLRIAEPLALQNAVLNAADQLLRKSGWKRVEISRRDKVFQNGSMKVAVRFWPTLEEDHLENWGRFANGLFRRGVADWAVVLACRILATDISRRIHRMTAIDLVDSRAFGDRFADAEYQELFKPFLIELEDR